MDEILDLIMEAWQYIKNICKIIINGILNFSRHVVGWFKSLSLKQNRDVPFIANADKAEFRQMIKEAPVKNVGIFQGVYNEETDEITYNEYIQADALDNQTRQVLGKESLVVLN
jgi:hypothetical protein